MRIDQVYSAYGSLGSAFKKKLGIPLYKDTTKPFLMRGCYGKQIERVFDNTSELVVIVWAGSDVMDFINRPELVKKIKDQAHRVKHIAISKFIADDLDKVGIEYRRVPLSAKDVSDIKPKPLGDSIYLYNSTSPKYGGPIMQYVKNQLPQFNYIECALHTYTRKELLEKYEECFIAIRPIAHDGLSNTVTELGSMGRRVIWNGDTPNAINFTSKEEIVELIKREYENKESLDYQKVAREMSEYLDVDKDDFLNIENWK